MGYELRRWLREELGPDITGLPRAVALEIADDAKDETRLSFATLEQLARWTAAKNNEVVRDALKRLAAAGWEFRRPLGSGKDGRLLYAVPGKRQSFYVPRERLRKGVPTPSEGVVTPSDGVTAPSGEGASSQTEGVTTPSERVTAPDEGVEAPSEGVATTPIPSAPVVSSPSPAAPDASDVAIETEGRVEEPTQGNAAAAEDVQHSTAVELARRFDFGREIDDSTKRRILDQLRQKLSDGWRPDELFHALDGRWTGASDRVAVWMKRIRDLPPQASISAPSQRDPAAKPVPPRLPQAVIVPADLPAEQQSSGLAEFRAARQKHVPRTSNVAPTADADDPACAFPEQFRTEPEINYAATGDRGA